MAASIVNLANVTVEFGKAVTKALPHPPPPSPDESPTLPFDSTEKEKREGEEQKGLPDGKQGKDCSANFSRVADYKLEAPLQVDIGRETVDLGGASVPIIGARLIFQMTIGGDHHVAVHRTLGNS